MPEVAVLLHRPALVVLTGPPGCGRSTLLRQVSAAAPGPVHAGGGLAALSQVAALALSRAVRAKLPTHDVHLLKKVPDSLIMRLDRGRLADPTGALRYPPRREAGVP